MTRGVFNEIVERRGSSLVRSLVPLSIERENTATGSLGEAGTVTHGRTYHASVGRTFRIGTVDHNSVRVTDRHAATGLE